jgi:GTPase
VRALTRLYTRRLSAEGIATPEFFRNLAQISVETGRQIGVLVHRSGDVDYVIVGDSQKLMLPDIGRLRAAKGRFRGLRLIHTHVRGEPISRDDLVDLTRLRLDLVAAVQLAPTGEIRGVSYAYNMPAAAGATSSPYRIVAPTPIHQLDVNVRELMDNLEAEFAQRAHLRDVVAKDGRAILIRVDNHSADGTYRLDELAELARTAGVEVVDRVLQSRERFDPKFVVGKGKLDDVILRACDLDASVLIFDHNLSPSQASAIAAVSDLKIIDRTQLILDIFAQRAESKDGRLQVELAQLKYSLPRLGQKDDALSRLTGGIGGRGPGETKLEIGKRRAKERVSHLEEQLERLRKRRVERRKKRTEVPSVAIIGYTNAGKSSLLNALCGSDVLAENKLFATLDTRSRVLNVGWAGYGNREVVATDTVGFIRDLPKDLFAAFRATFEEAAFADLLMQVVDASDPSAEEHIDATEDVLRVLELNQLPRLLVWNKCDVAAPERLRALRMRYPGASFVSARDRTTLRPLVGTLAESMEEAWHTAARGPDLSPIEEPVECTVESEDPSEVTTLEEMLRLGGKRKRKERVENVQ